ncbi:MAG: DUF2961 domain-containing protein [Tannerella sp.]|jgi:hypothetical protein|nr:DUF2961 domain-containing protein [Tannerella sp.]
MNNKNKLFTLACLFLCLQQATAQQFDVTFKSLLQEMTDRTAVAKKPLYPYKSLQASSYNRGSVSPDEPATWFLNSDNGFDLRKEFNNGREESVVMECDGPGVVTRIWTPFFYFNMNNRQGPDIMFYLDGDKEPTIRANFIELVTGKAFVSSPFAVYTCRAGDLYLPVSFSKSCKITISNKAFYYIINYRKYDANVKVETFQPDFMEKHRKLLEKTGRELTNPQGLPKGKRIAFAENINATDSVSIVLPKGNSAIGEISFRLSADNVAQALRSTVVEMIFDGQSTVWCPLGDFFGNVNSIEPYKTWEREVKTDGTMICRWVMPYRNTAEIRIHNLGKMPVNMNVSAVISPWKWTADSYYFHANWWTDKPYTSEHPQDLTFVEVKGEGVYVGDNMAVLNPQPWWWGEGDEKIYIDEDFDRKFPSHFGTGTEDYYGWAGGEHPTRADEFSTPFLANIRVGGETRGFTGAEPHTRGYNICTRSRSLDAIPFNKRLRADIEASNGVTAKPDDLLQYALTAFWYGAGSASHNRPPLKTEASLSVPQIEDLLPVNLIINK